MNPLIEKERNQSTFSSNDSGNHPRRPTQTTYIYTRGGNAGDPSPSSDVVHSNTTPKVSSSSTNASVKATVSKIPTTVIVTIAAIVAYTKKYIYILN